MHFLRLDSSLGEKRVCTFIRYSNAQLKTNYAESSFPFAYDGRLNLRSFLIRCQPSEAKVEEDSASLSSVVRCFGG
ncbi:hypothetical protein H5410_042055 [Solanum commersonii]|uniref:Uncharacterized protein n=1 Tax=Solanum commersonii TaxID=4109 RepID=A0A9J5XUN2_SOLCO|nr:hypothetical protein H5410_042055 [Solanum commersonii]